MISRFRPHTSAIMFDVGSTGIRACQLTRRTGRLALSDHLQLDLASPVQDEQDAAHIDCDRFARALGQARFSGRRVGLVLSPPAIQFHTLEAPGHLLDKPEHLVRTALAWEIARETRTEPGDWEVRYWAFPPGHRPGRNIMSVAISSSLARGWVSDFAGHGLQLRRITVSPCALARIASRAWQTDERNVWGVLDIGHHRSILTVLVREAPVYVRSIPIGANHWTRRIATVFDIPPAEAEEIKRQHGLQPGRSDSSAAGDHPPGDQAEVCGVMFTTLRPLLDDIVREINRCFLYVLESYPSLSVERLFVAGGGARLNGLEEYLSLQLDLPTTRLACSLDTSRPTQVSGSQPAPMPHEGAASLGGSLLDMESA